MAHGGETVLAVVGVPPRGAVLAHPQTVAETTAQIRKDRSMRAFLPYEFPSGAIIRPPFKGTVPEGIVKLVARALQRVQFRAYPKGSQDQVFRCMRNGFNS